MNVWSKASVWLAVAISIEIASWNRPLIPRWAADELSGCPGVLVSWFQMTIRSLSQRDRRRVPSFAGSAQSYIRSGKSLWRKFHQTPPPCSFCHQLRPCRSLFLSPPACPFWATSST
jgi:hypothetical protein